jgi:hypothetical protein
MTAIVIIVGFVALVALGVRHGADSRFVDRPGRQL